MKKALLLSAALVAAMTANAGYFVVGANVNGSEDWNGNADKELLPQGNGIYRWTGTELGTGFKINAGNGDWSTVNIGSNGSAIENGEPYYYGYGDNPGNISILGTAIVSNPVLELDENEMTITLTWDEGGEVGYKWYIAGINGTFSVTDEAFELKPETEGSQILKGNIDVTVEEGEFKLSSSGWAIEYGTNDAENVFINSFDGVMTITLEEVYGEAGNVFYTLDPGNYDVTFNLDTLVLTFAKSGNDAVEGIEAETGEAVYYNLQGVKVANPENGVFVKVAGGKAVKVAL